MKSEVFHVTREELRTELAEDLGRGGYVFRPRSDPAGVDRYFDKQLVLTRPGLLIRAARLLTDLLPTDAERLAVVDVAAATLGTALSQHTGIPLLLGRREADGAIRFDGEYYPQIRCVLVEDVVFTGGQAHGGAAALLSLGADLLGIVCLLDRENGAARRLGEAGIPIRALFLESELLRMSRRNR